MAGQDQLPKSGCRVNPLKQELYEEGINLAEAFLDLNNLHYPAWQIDPTLQHRGEYTPDLVRTNLDNCLLPVGVPGYQWSFPGYKADNTPLGVVAHETGHHVHHVLGYPSVPPYWYRGEPVTNYEPNWAESWAETIKLMITNPNLLREGKPLRWDHLEDLGLKAVHDTPWRQVLETRGAHPRIVAAAGNWVSRAVR